MLSGYKRLRLNSQRRFRRWGDACHLLRWVCELARARSCASACQWFDLGTGLPCCRRKSFGGVLGAGVLAKWRLRLSGGQRRLREVRRAKKRRGTAKSLVVRRTTAGLDVR